MFLVCHLSLISHELEGFGNEELFVLVFIFFLQLSFTTSRICYNNFFHLKHFPNLIICFRNFMFPYFFLI